MAASDAEFNSGRHLTEVEGPTDRVTAQMETLASLTGISIIDVSSTLLPALSPGEFFVCLFSFYFFVVVFSLSFFLCFSLSSFYSFFLSFCWAVVGVWGRGSIYDTSWFDFVEYSDLPPPYFTFHSMYFLFCMTKQVPKRMNA